MLDHNRFNRAVHGAGFYVFDGVNNVHAFNNFTEHSVTAVQPRSWNSCYEELRTVGVRAGICHRKDAWFVMLWSACREFVFETVARAACAVTEWASALDHEIFDHTVENQTVIERLFNFVASFRIGPLFRAFCKADKVFYCFRSFIVEKLNFEIAFGCLK